MTYLKYNYSKDLFASLREDMNSAIKKCGETKALTEDLDVLCVRNIEKLKHELYDKVNG